MKFLARFFRHPDAKLRALRAELDDVEGWLLTVRHLERKYEARRLEILAELATREVPSATGEPDDIARRNAQC